MLCLENIYRLKADLILSCVDDGEEVGVDFKRIQSDGVKHLHEARIGGSLGRYRDEAAARLEDVQDGERGSQNGSIEQSFGITSMRFQKRDLSLSNPKH